MTTNRTTHSADEREGRTAMRRAAYVTLLSYSSSVRKESRERAAIKRLLRSAKETTDAR